MRGVALKLDREYELFYGFKALSEIESKLNINIISDGLDKVDLTVKNVAFIVLAGIRNRPENMTAESMMELIDEHSTLGEVMAAMEAAIVKSIGSESEKKQ
jgi:hypothetical protein